MAFAGNFPWQPMPPAHQFHLHNLFVPNPACDEAVVCVVCGGICKPTVMSAVTNWQFSGFHRDWMHPWLIKGKDGFMDWCKQPSTGRAYRRSDDDQLEVIPVEQFRGGAEGFYGSAQDRMVINTKDTAMMIPIHLPCLELAKHFCRYQSKFDIDFRNFQGSQGGSPSSIAHLYEIWMKRALMTNPGHLGPLHQPIDEPSAYLGAVVARNLGQYVSRVISRFKGMTLIQEVDPSGDTLKTTSIIMRCVKNIRDAEHTGPKPKYATLWQRIQDMPVEIKDRITEAMEPFDDLGPDQLYCTRIAPSSWWRDQLLSGALVPWLHDLHAEGVRSVEDLMREVIPEHADLDWERLCRELAQPDVFGPAGILHGHAYLENRHRIWRLLNSARLGHVLTRRSGQPDP